MRNLKKILALALALVMSLSLMATANAFTDDDSITDTYETAVTVLSGLKVFQGYDDGTFQPKGAITRAEVAAIIYRIVTGDVADTQVGIYADYNKFDDVASTSWYAGYVNFCANAEYIKGYDARTFGPNDPVTGYQALAMILRALGYDKNGEFTGTNWTIQTAAVGEQRGITKNITAGTLGVPATREVVAEILFRAILVPTVNYTPAFGYTIGDTSLGYKTFGLEEITGVVVANEYADLYSDSPMKAGRTELDVDGESYVIDHATTLEDIGEAHAAYITGSTVLTIEKTGNTVFETGDEADISSDSKFEDVTGLERGDAEEFVNFDGGSEYKVSDWKLSYVLKFEAADNDALDRFLKDEGLDLDHTDFKPSSNLIGYEYTREVTFNAGKAIPSADIGAMKYIFNEADKENDKFVLGEVYVGTQSDEDISDDPDMSWKSFQNKYIDTDENAIEVEENENGNWLKVVDNDGDGIADVVMKTIYTVTGVEDIDKNGAITLSCDEKSLDAADALNRLDEDDDIDVVAEDEVNEGDIVYYAVIDGNAYTYLAEVVTAEIEKVNRNTLTATTTDGDEYVQSGVCEHTYWDEIAHGVKNLEGDVNYDLYLDKFGYLAAFTESTNNAGFVLITDGFFKSDRSEDTYAAMVWDGEDLVDTDVTSGGSRFIYDVNHDNGWDNLRWFDGVNANYDEATKTWSNKDIQTIVAALSDDGTLTPVDDLYRYREDVVMISLGDDADNIPDRGETIGHIYDTTSNRTAYDQIRYVRDADGDLTNKLVEADIRGLSSTVYYFVYNTDDGTVVREYVGYANTPDLGNDADKVENIYAVASRAEDANDDDYYTAEIVVVEMEDGYNQIDREEIFLVDMSEAVNGVSQELATVIRGNGEKQQVLIDLEKSIEEYREYDPAWDKVVAPGLYYMWESADEDNVYVIAPMSFVDIADSNYITGTVLREEAVGASDWASFIPYTNNWLDHQAHGWKFAITSGNEISEKCVDDSKYYTLSYSDVDTWTDRYGDVWYDYKANLDPGDRGDVLEQKVKGQENNYVLVSYNSNDEIIYAISFRFEDSYMYPTMTNTSDADDVFTGSVWAHCTPAAPETYVPEDFSVSFYGNDVTDATNNTETIDYTDAVAGVGLNVTGGWVDSVTSNNVLLPDGVPGTLDPNGATYYAVIYNETTKESELWILTLDKAETGKELTDITDVEDDLFDIDEDTVSLANGVLEDLKESQLVPSKDAKVALDKENLTITVTAEAGGEPAVYNIVEGAFIYVNDELQGFVANGQEFEMPDDADTYVSDNVVGTISAGDTFTMNSEKPGVIEFYGLYKVNKPANDTSDPSNAEYAGNLVLTVDGKEIKDGAFVPYGATIKVSYVNEDGTTNFGKDYHVCYEAGGKFGELYTNNTGDTAIEYVIKDITMPASAITLHVHTTTH